MRHARGAHSSTWALNPFLFGYHRNDQSSQLQWNALFFNFYSHQSEKTRYSMLGLLNGSSSENRSWWSLFPLAYSLEQKQGELPDFVIPSVFHLYSHSQDSQESRWSVLGLLANGSSARDTSDYSFRILHRWARFERSGNYQERKVEPFFTWEKNAETGKSYFSIGKFLYISKQENHLAPVKRYLLGFIPLQ